MKCSLRGSNAENSDTTLMGVLAQDSMGDLALQTSDPTRQWCQGNIRTIVSRYVLLEYKQAPEESVKASVP